MKWKEIKERVTLAEIVTLAGYLPVKLGTDQYGLNPCPYCKHNDAFRWKSSNNLYKCFSCGEAGDIISFAGEKLWPQLPDLKAVCTKIEKEFLLETRDDSPGEKKSTTRQPPAVTTNNILLAASEFYESAGSRNQERFQSWQKKRKYKTEVLDKYAIGFTKGGDYLVKHLKHAGYSTADLLTSGLVKQDKKDPGKLYDFFYKPGIIYPYHDENGWVTHLKQKPVNTAGEHAGNPYQLRSTEHTPLFFGMRKIADKGKYIYVVEGETDVLAMAHDSDIAVIALGKRISGRQIDWIQKMIQVKNIVLCFDNDVAGQSYYDSLADLAALPKAAYLQVTPNDARPKGQLYRSSPPVSYKDPDESFRAGSTDWHKTRTPIYLALADCLSAYRAAVEEAEGKYSSNTVAKIIYEWFTANGFFFVQDDIVNLAYDGQVYGVDTKLPFKSLLYRLAGINYAHRSSKAIWEALTAISFHHARRIGEANWLHTDTDTPTTLWHAGDNQIVCMRSGQVTITPGGTGDILLIDSPKLLPVTIKKMNEKAEAAAALGELINITRIGLATGNPWQAYLVAFIVNTLFLGWTRASGVHNFTGQMGCGKSDGANLLTALLYGQTFVTAGSVASNYSDSTRNPLIILDNLESRNIHAGIKDFLLHVGTGIVRQKRKIGTDTDNVYERSLTQIITTSIEQFETPELIERTIIIPFAKKYFHPEYPGSSLMEGQITKHRDNILSAIVQVVAEMLPTFAEKRIKKIKWLQENNPDHAKQRLNEHLATLAVIIDAITDRVPAHGWRLGDGNGHLAYWIGEQDALAKELNAETNLIVRYLGLLEYGWRNGEHDFNFEERENIIYAECFLDQLLAQFDILARTYQLKDRYHSVRHLALRIANEKSVLLRSGWHINKTSIVRGRQKYEIYSKV